MIFNNGSDATVVEMLAFGLDEAARRGYHALTFDGPGQGQALYEQGLYFRHDWEQVITPIVVSWAVSGRVRHFEPGSKATRMRCGGLARGAVCRRSDRPLMSPREVLRLRPQPDFLLYR